MRHDSGVETLQPKVMKYFILSLLLTAGFIAEATTLAGRHTVVGLLSIRAGETPKLVVNPMRRSRYTLHVANADMVAAWARSSDFSGLVRVVMDVLPKLESHSPVKILKIERVHLRRVPLYDAHFKAVPSGNG